MSDTQILTKEFTLPEVLSVISGYLLTNQGFDRIHELIRWTAGTAIFTHQIPSVAPYIQRALVKQFPDFDLAENASLASDIEILVGAFKSGNDQAAIALGVELEKRWGKRFQVAPMQPFDELEVPSLLDGLDPKKTIIAHVASDEFPDNLDA